MHFTIFFHIDFNQIFVLRINSSLFVHNFMTEKDIYCHPEQNQINQKRTDSEWKKRIYCPSEIHYQISMKIIR